ncbi:MAG: magnesium transporter [Actinobacteria bacterium]|nr:magnesium transporter [Actinomycetota bacterium]
MSPSRRSPAGLQRLRSGRADAAQRLVALLIGVLVATLGGLVLAASEGTLAELPGLLLLVPGAVALRGNVFGAMGSRLGTAAHAGTLRLNFRPEGVVGGNLLAAGALSLASSMVLAVLAKGTATVFGLSGSMTLADFLVVSTLGGLIASSAVGVVTVGLVVGSVRFGWDLDNVTAPLVTTIGDLFTVPALVIAAAAAGHGVSSSALAVGLVGGSGVVLVAAWRAPVEEVGRIVRQSVPVLVVAVVLDLLAGITIERRLDDLLDAEALLILLPAFLGGAGALGGVLCSRLSTQFHLGLDDATPLPSRASGRDIRSVVLLALPVFALGAVAAHVAATLTGQTGPALGQIMGVALLAGGLATVFVVLVAYYSTMASFRFGLDPDTYGIPLVTSSLDLVGVFTLVLAMVAVGVT